VRQIAAYLATLAAAELEIGVLYLAGETPQGKIGVGYRVLQEATEVQQAVEATLELADVDHSLTALASIRGAGSTAKRQQLLADLFVRATADEQHFLLRLLIGELRQGALAGIMVEAIAAAAGIAVNDVRRASMYSSNLGALARLALTEGVHALDKFQLKTLTPVAPMLAQTASDVATALQQLEGEVAFEWKVDGARVQVHKAGGEVRVYTRSLNDVTAAVPEIVETIAALSAQEIVLDGETVALDAKGRPLPFQVAMRRYGRKLDVATLRAELPLHVYYFDCLRLEQTSLADRPASERCAALTSAVPASQCIPRIVTRDLNAAQAFYADALAQGHEGVMAKSLASAYEAGSRGASWLKIKRAHTLDLVVLAAEWGHGRRTGWLSNLHLGARDSVTGGFVMLGKTFKGLTDATLAWQTQEFLARETHRDRWAVHVRPELVVEIAFNDIQASSQYPGGYALRFARVKSYRADKTARDADTIETIRTLYAAQSGVERSI
jgi:DNA ligase-1